MSSEAAVAVAGHDLSAQVGRLLTELRGTTSRAAQARDLGIGRTQLARLEDGQWNITLRRLQELADGYGVSFVITAVDATDGQPLS